MKPLYELTEDMHALAKLADDPEMEESVKDTMEGIVAAFEEKAQAIVIVTKEFAAEEAKIKSEVNRLQARLKAITNKREALKDYLRENMDRTGINSIKCPLLHLNIIRSNGRDKVVIDDVDSIPDDYVTLDIQKKVDKAALLRDTNEGLAIDGCHLESGKSIISFR
jgi:hypothetical protein